MSQFTNLTARGLSTLTLGRFDIAPAALKHAQSPSFGCANHSLASRWPRNHSFHFLPKTLAFVTIVAFRVSPFTCGFLRSWPPRNLPLSFAEIMHRNWQFPHRLAGDFTTGFHLEQMTNGVNNLVWQGHLVFNSKKPVVQTSMFSAVLGFVYGTCFYCYTYLWTCPPSSTRVLGYCQYWKIRRI